MKTRIAALFLVCCLVLGLTVSTRAEYTYTVRFYSGIQGSFEGEDVIVYSNLHYGDRVTFLLRMVTLEDDSKYYIKGIRESGKDNNTVGLMSFQVTRDQDYTVAYGILGDSVAYTINYLDVSGNSLAPSETYYANVGDKIVVSFQYIDGYEPEYYNLTRTLTENAADNTFDFIYHAVQRLQGDFTVNIVEGGGIPPAPGIIVPGNPPAPGPGGGEGPEPGPGGEPGTEPGGEPGTDPLGENSEGSGRGEYSSGTDRDPGTGATEGEGYTGPEEILDLDTPGSRYVDGSEDGGSRSGAPWYKQTWAKAAAAALAVLVIGVIILLLRKRRKKEKTAGT